MPIFHKTWKTSFWVHFFERNLFQKMLLPFFRLNETLTSCKRSESTYLQLRRKTLDKRANRQRVLHNTFTLRVQIWRWFLKYMPNNYSIFKTIPTHLQFIWDKVFKNEPSKICGRQPFKNLKGYGLLTFAFLPKAHVQTIHKKPMFEHIHFEGHGRF